jgi:hypothetical protein
MRSRRRAPFQRPRVPFRLQEGDGGRGWGRDATDQQRRGGAATVEEPSSTFIAAVDGDARQVDDSR